MSDDEFPTRIGQIGNYYGGLLVKKEGHKFFWLIEDYQYTAEWQEIPESLYNELIAYNNKLNGN